MKTPRVLLAAAMLALLSGCATGRQSSDGTAARAAEKAPAWQVFLGCLFGCAAQSALDYGRYQQSIQSGDPTR